MNAMTILKRCRAAKSDIERLQQRIGQRRDVLTSLSAPQADPNGGSRGSADRDKIGRIMADIDALERELEAREDAERAEKVAVCALMDMVPDKEGKILFGYYVKRLDTGAIARKEKYQVSYVRRVKRDAEKLIGMLSEEKVNATLPPWYLKEKGGERE